MAGSLGSMIIDRENLALLSPVSESIRSIDVLPFYEHSTVAEISNLLRNAPNLEELRHPLAPRAAVALCASDPDKYKKENSLSLKNAYFYHDKFFSCAGDESLQPIIKQYLQMCGIITSLHVETCPFPIISEENEFEDLEKHQHCEERFSELISALLQQENLRIDNLYLTTGEFFHASKLKLIHFLNFSRLSSSPWVN